MTSLTQQLDQLGSTQIIRLAQANPELEYLFRHPLLQAAAYESLLRANRKQLHLAVGEVLEQLYPERTEELSPVLAQHFILAGEDERALTYCKLAGEVAAHKYANVEAAMHYAHAIDIAKRIATAAELGGLFSKLGRVLELNSQHAEALANYQAMDEWAQTHGDRAMQLAAKMSMATLYSTGSLLHNMALAEERSAECLALARELGDRVAEARILWNRLNVYRFDGAMAEALRCGELGLAVARESGERELLAFILNDMTHVYIGNGRVQPGLASLTEAAALWRALDNRPMLADNLGTAGLYFTMLGRYSEAIAATEEAYAISDAIDNAWGRSYSRSFVGRAFWEMGDFTRAIAVMEEGIKWGDRSGFSVAQTQTRADLGDLYGCLGDTKTGLVYAREAAALAADIMPPFQAYALAIQANLHRLRGELALAAECVQTAQQIGAAHPHPLVTVTLTGGGAWLALGQGQFTEALTALDQVADLMSGLDFKAFVPEFFYVRGLAFWQSGQIESAHSALLEARACSEAIRARRFLWRILVALAEIETHYGHTTEAAALRAEARTILHYLVDHCPPTHRDSFLNLAEVKQVLATDL